MRSKSELVKSQVGIHPREWEIKKIEQFANVRTGPFGSLLHQDDYVQDGTPIITVEHLGYRGIIHENLPMVSDKDKQRLSAYLLRKHDIVFSRVGSVDRNSIVKKDEEGWLFSGRLLRIRTGTNDVYSPYLSYYFSSESFKNRIRNVAVGQTMASLNTKIMNNIEVVLPPKNEQHAIAEVLSDVDALIEAQEALIEKKRLIKQGVMQELLTGKRRLPGYRGEWQRKKLGEICANITTGKLDANAMVKNGIYRFFTCAREIYNIDKYAFDTEALLISGNGANVGYIHYYNGKFNAYQRTYVLSDFTEEIQLIKFLLDINLQDRIKVEVNAGNTPYIKLDTLTEMILDLPIDKDEQKKISQIINDIDNEIYLLEKKLKKLNLIKRGLMQELLTGRTRLV